MTKILNNAIRIRNGTGDKVKYQSVSDVYRSNIGIGPLKNRYVSADTSRMADC